MQNYTEWQEKTGPQVT